MKKYKSAYILGKFFPFHKGHRFLIDTASNFSKKVTVLVCSRECEDKLIDGNLRYYWVKETFKNYPNVFVKYCNEELPQYPEESDNFWEIWVDVAKRYCPDDIDVIFTSETYGDEYAKQLGIKHHMVDFKRKNFPISGTNIRNDVFKHYDFLPEVVKPYFTKRIAIMGVESVGKSILTERLANHYKTNFVQEWGRVIYERNGNKISLNDFLKISKERKEIEKKLIVNSNKILFTDTEDIITYIFSKLYYPYDYKEIEEYFINSLKIDKPYDLYILLTPDCEAIQDGTRNFLKERNIHHEMIKKELEIRKLNYIEIGGFWENRFKKSCEMIDNLFV